MLIDCGRLVNIAIYKIHCRIITNVSNLSAKKEKKGAHSWFFEANELKNRQKCA